MLRRVLVAVLLAGATVGPTLQNVPARVQSLQQGVPVVIDFEDLTTTAWGTGGQTVVSDQYAVQGVTFNDPLVLDYAGGSFGDPNFLHSGSNAIQQCYSQEGCDTPLVMTFAEPQRRVKVWVGFWDSLSEALVVELTAFEAAQGGAEVASASATLGPSDDPHIPVQTPLEVTVDGNAIRRVEVSFSPPSDLAVRLVFDDVEFDSDSELSTCPAGTASPEVVLELPERGDVVHSSALTLQGRVETPADLTEATLTVTSGEFATTPPSDDVGIEPVSETIRSKDILTEVVPPAGGTFGPISIEGALLPGENVVTLTLWNCAGADGASANVAYSTISEGTRYEMLALEVTQAIQDMNNGVSLIAGKRTFVRVYLRTRGGADWVHSVSGKLRGCHVQVGNPPDCLSGDSEFAPLDPLNPITVNDSDILADKRENLSESLIFELPPEWTNAGLLHLELDDESLSPNLPCDNCDNVTVYGDPRAYEFKDAPPVVLDLVDVTYELEGTPYAPHEIDHIRLESWLERAYPTDEVIVSSLSVLPFVDARPTDCYTVNARMFAAQTTETIASPSTLPDARARYYGLVASPKGDPLEGCAGIDKSGTYINQFAVGPAGYGDAYKWDDDDGSYADFYAGHELAHTYYREHPGVCVPNSHDDDYYPFDDGYISEDDVHFGFDAGDATVLSNEVATDSLEAIEMDVYAPDDWTDIMTYCDYQWISSYTYQGVFDRMISEGEAPPSLARMATPQPEQEILLVSGTIDLDNNTAILRPFLRLPGDLVSPLPPNSPFSIDLENRSGRILATYPFYPRTFSDTPADAPTIAQLSEVVPWEIDTERIVIRRVTTRFTWRGPRRVVRDLAVQPVSADSPQVRLITPNGGERLQRANYNVTWRADDANHDEMTYTLLYSADGGTTWQTAAEGITVKQFNVDVGRLPGSTTALFRVIATDGVNTGQDDSDAVFLVPATAPSVRIISPGNGASFRTSQTIVLDGKATDIEQGELDDASLRWSSDIQGALGEGRSVAVSDLTPGLHTITLTATDRDGLATDASIVLEIVEDDLPILEWSPAIGTSFVPHGQFAYDSDDAVGTFYASDGEGGITPVRTLDPLLNGWTAIVPGSFSGNDDFTDLLFYAAQPGLGEFYASDGEGGLRLLSGSEGFTRGWDLIVPGNFGGDDDRTDLFFYNAEEGEGKFYTTDGKGRIRLLGNPESFLRGWSSIVPGNFGGDAHTDLLFYDKTTGLARFYATDGEGGLELLSEDLTWTVGWDQIVPGNFSGDDWTDVFLYDAETGDGAFSTTDGEGGIVPLGLPDTFLTTWSIIIAGDFGGNDDLTDLFFYDAERGLGEFYTADGQGGLEPLSSTAGFAQGWDQIIPGHFGGA
jgi:hypothetical protein